MGSQIIDIGINLMHRQFDSDREEIIKNAQNNNITPLIITGTNIRESKKAANYSEKFPQKLYSTAGIHPHDAKTCNENTIKELTNLLKRNNVCAVGECGLDYDRDFSPRDVQRNWFEKQIILAEKLNKPLFLHERKAFDDFFSILSNYKSICSKSVVHCFTGTEKELDKYLSLGCYIGITGWICDERRGKNLRDIIKIIPLNKLMIETDAPFLIPRNMSNNLKYGRNEPVYLRHILNEISKCLNKDSNEVAKITTDNAKLFFGLK